MDQQSRNRSSTLAGSVIVIAGGALLFLGALLAAVTFYASVDGSTLNRSWFQLGANLSFSVDGLFLILFGVLEIFMGIGQLTGVKFPGLVARVPIWSGIVIFIYVIFLFYNIFDMINTTTKNYPSIHGSAGPGLWLVTFGALLALVGEIEIVVAGKRIGVPVDKVTAAILGSSSKGNTTANNTDETGFAPPEVKKCPYCAETIKYEAIICRFCGKSL